MRGVVGLALLSAALLTASGCDRPARGERGEPAERTLRAGAMALGGGWTEAQVRRYAAVYEVVVVGTSARADRVRLFREARPGILVLAYTSGFDVHDDGPLYAWIRDQHPDWFLRDTTGRPLRTYRTSSRWALDCGRPEVRAFFADSARRRVRALGVDGIFEDNVLPSWDFRNLAPGATRLERYATVAQWRAALERYLGALEEAVAPGIVGANQVVPWTRHARLVSVEQLPPSGPGWERVVRDFAAMASDSSRIPFLQHRLSGPDDPQRAFVTASYLLAVRPGALLGLQWDGPRESVTALPEFDLALGRPRGEARQENGVWWRDFDRARVLVNPTERALPAPWPAWSRAGAGGLLPAGRAGIAWRPGAAHPELPYWVSP